MIYKSWLVILFLLPAALFAQSKLPENMFLRTLPNGLNILVVEDNSVPLATIMMTFKAGAFVESENTNGFTALYTSMLFKANKDYPDENAFHYHLGQLGAVNNYNTEEEYSTGYFILPKSNLEAGLINMNSAIRFAKMLPGELEKQKEITNDQLKQKESTAGFALFNAMSHNLWGGLYYKKIAIGNRQSINAATISSLDSIKNKYFYPDNALLIVGGDVMHDYVFGLAERIYGSWKAGGFDPFKKWPVPEFKPLSKTVYFIVGSPLAQTPVIAVNWQGPDTRNDIPSTYAADIFSYIINQKLSKLNTALLQSGLAITVNAGYLTLKHVGPITLTVEPNPARIKECLLEVQKQISIMGDDDYLTDEQVADAKRMLEIKTVRQEEVTSDYVHTLSFWWASASLNYFVTYNDKMMKVTRADVKAYVNKYIKGKPYCAGLLISPALSEKVGADTFFKPVN